MRAVGIAIVFLLYFRVASSLQQFKVVKVEYTANPKYIVNTTCKLKPVNRFKAIANMDGDIVKPLRNISMHLQLFKKDYANQYKPFLLNLTSNVCDALNKKLFNFYTRIIWKLLKEFTNANHSCPYSGHIFVRNGYFDQKFVAFIAPLGIYKVVFRFFEGYPPEEFGYFAGYLEILEDTKRKQN